MCAHRAHLVMEYHIKGRWVVRSFAHSTIRKKQKIKFTRRAWPCGDRRRTHCTIWSLRLRPKRSNGNLHAKCIKNIHHVEHELSHCSVVCCLFVFYRFWFRSVCVFMRAISSNGERNAHHLLFFNFSGTNIAYLRAASHRLNDEEQRTE